MDKKLKTAICLIAFLWLQQIDARPAFHCNHTGIAQPDLPGSGDQCSYRFYFPGKPKNAI